MSYSPEMSFEMEKDIFNPIAISEVIKETSISLSHSHVHVYLDLFYKIFYFHVNLKVNKMRRTTVFFTRSWD